MPSSPPAEPRHRGLAVRMGLVFFAFAIAGSLLLLAWFAHQERRNSERVFLALAQADADFIRQMNLPRSEKLALDLSRLLKMLVFFREPEGRMVPPADHEFLDQLKNVPAAAKAVLLRDGRTATAIRIDAEHDVIFVRLPDVTPASSLARPATMIALGAFWLLSLGLAWAVARSVVRPLTSLTRRLPALFTEPAAPVPEAARHDEIGLLATALTDAREKLAGERAMREQSEKLALLGRVAAGLAHEIKNPVASIHLHSQLIPLEPLDAESRQSLALIQSETGVIEGLVNQWLFLARPAPPQMSPLDLGELLQSITAALRAQAAHSGANIDLEVAAGIVIQGDRQRLAQAFRNLSLNAIQAMPSGGALRISARQEDREAIIVFTDTGPGFSAAALQRGSELFYSEREGGMGIGLNVAREVIASHGGRLRLENTEPHGARVTIHLPLAERGPSQPV